MQFLRLGRQLPLKRIEETFGFAEINVDLLPVQIDAYAGKQVVIAVKPFESLVVLRTRMRLVQTHPYRSFVGGKSFGVGDHGALFADGVDAGFTHGDDGGFFEEILHAQRRVEASRAAGREGVVWAGDVVPDGLGSVAPQEDRSGMANSGEEAHGVFGDHFEVLGGDLVHQIDCLIHVAGNNDRPPLLDRRAGNGLPREGTKEPFDRLAHRSRQIGIIGDEDRAGHLIVLGL